MAVQRRAVSRRIGLVILLVLVGMGSSIPREVPGAEVPFSEDFESLAEGSIDGQDGWSVAKGEGAVVVGTARFGQKALRTMEDSEVALAVEGGENVFWLDLWIVTPGSPYVAVIPPLPKKSAVLVFDAVEGIQALDGNGMGGGMIVDSGVLLDSGKWYRATIKLDFDIKKWDLYVDGVRRLTDLGFHSNDVTGLSGMVRTAYAPSCLDALSFTGVSLTDDSDQDGLTDLDEMRLYGTDPLSSDTDGDGMQDGDEIAAGTLPTDHRSFFYLRIATGDAASAMELSAPTVEGKVYELQATEDIGIPDSWYRVGQFVGDGLLWVWMVTNHTQASKRFYRLVVLPR